MMLNDGRCRLCDFGIVGRISADTWQSLLALIARSPKISVPLLYRDDGMGVSATNRVVNVPALASTWNNCTYSLTSDDDRQ